MAYLLNSCNSVSEAITVSSIKKCNFWDDWEMDTIVGPRNKDAMLTLVERSQGFSIITKLPKGKDSEGVLKAAYRELLPYMGYIRSITTDNGTEFAMHRELAEMLGTKIYFAHPYASWEKGLVEYTNKLYRQYIPKGANFDNYTEEQIKQIQYKIKSINLETPPESELSDGTF